MTPKIAKLHEDAPLTDVHIHPSLKAWLFNRNLWRHWFSTKFFNPFATRSDFELLERGKVGVIWATHHAPELELFDDSFPIRFLTKLSGLYAKLTRGSNFERVTEMIDLLEEQAAREPGRVEIAKSLEDVERIRSAGKIALVHAVEGGHVLDGDPHKIKDLAERGVASLTLTHFYTNQIASQVDAVPDGHFIKKISSFDFHAGEHPPLTNFGRDILAKMVEHDIIIDITHCDPASRAEIYSEVPPDHPLVATHVGVHEHHASPMNLTDDEIREIASRNGAVGVILFTHWLDKNETGTGLPAVWNTIKHLHDVTDSWNHIMIGSDFDGFTSPPNAVSHAGEFGTLTQMLIDKGLSDNAIKKILGGNAIRVMRDVWGKNRTAKKDTNQRSET